MIPDFPQWKPLSLDDQEQIAQASLPLLPHSDHSFALLWSWNKDQGIAVSRYHGSMFLRIANAVTGRPSFTFIPNPARIGNPEVINDAARALLSVAATESDIPAIQLIPEQIAAHLDTSRLVVTSDEDAADYLMASHALAELPGPAHSRRRRSCAVFERDCTADVNPLDLTLSGVREKLLDVSDQWLKLKMEAGKSYDLNLSWGIGNDRVALERVIGAAQTLQVVGLGVSIGGSLVAFTLTEILPPPYAIVMFLKFTTEYEGLQEFLVRETARHLIQAHSRSVLNFEEDGGSEGLRRFKQSLRPFAYLRKFTVTRRCPTTNVASPSQPACAIRT